MDFFPEFKWAVPKAFADAVFQTRFEEGDVLYDSKEAYDKWDKAKEQITNSIQIRFPSKVVTALSNDNKSVLSRNWNSEVRLNLYENSTKVGQGLMHTTQGRLFTLLWKGDLNVLDTNAVNPEPPMIAMQVKKELKKKFVDIQPKAIEIADGSLIFVMVYDAASPLLKGKYDDLLQQLRCKPVRLPPKEAGLKNWREISPTIEILFFKSANLSEPDFEDKLKQALYKPSLNKKTDKENFKISGHGILFSP